MAKKDFVFSFDGVDYRFDDLFISEMEELEQLLGVTWGQMRPIGITRHGRMIAAMVLRRSKTEEEVAAVFAGMTAAQLRAAWQLRESDLPDVYEEGVPLAEAGDLPTPGS